MPPDSSQPIAIIIYYRPHGLINMLSNEQPLIADHGSRLTLPKLPREPTGYASSGAAGGTQRPSPCPKLCHVLLSYCVCVLPFLLSDIPGPRLISREDAHLMYPRYLRDFLFVMNYCPLPPRSLWERLVVSLSCTCVAFSPFAKLNRFFPKKNTHAVWH